MRHGVPRADRCCSGLGHSAETSRRTVPMCRLPKAVVAGDGDVPDILSLLAEDMLANAWERRHAGQCLGEKYHLADLPARPTCAPWQPPSKGDGSASRLTSR